MKKTLIITLVSIFFAGSLSAQSVSEKENLSRLYQKYGVVPNPNNPYNENISKEVMDSITNAAEFVGIVHNAALDSIFPKLEKEKLRLLKEYSVPTLSDLTEDIKAKIRADMNNLLNIEVTNFMKELKLNEEEEEDIDFTYPNVANNKSVFDSIASPFTKEYMAKFYEIINKSNPSNIDAIVDKIKELETEIKANAPTENDLAITLYTVVTGRYSTQYWSANRGRLKSMFSTTADNTYPGLTKEESAVVYGYQYGIFAHPSNPEKYILFPPNGKPSVKQCEDGYIFDDRIKTCSPKK
jgi:hypothetical protein